MGLCGSLKLLMGDSRWTDQAQGASKYGGFDQSFFKRILYGSDWLREHISLQDVALLFYNCFCRKDR